jgi:hypothetical protein
VRNSKAFCIGDPNDVRFEKPCRIVALNRKLVDVRSLGKRIADES